MNSFTHESLTPRERQAFARIVDALGFAPRIVLGRGWNSHPLTRLLPVSEAEDILYGVVPGARPPHERGEIERFTLVVIRVPTAATVAPPTKQSKSPRKTAIIAAPVAATDSDRLLAAFRRAGPKGLDRQEIHRVFYNRKAATEIVRLLAQLHDAGYIGRLSTNRIREERWSVQPKRQPKDEPAVITRRRRRAQSRSWEARKARWGKIGMSPEGLAKRKAAYFRWLEARRAAKESATPLAADDVDLKQKLFE